jgi:uncharacterized protein (TIGR03086 family)
MSTDVSPAARRMADLVAGVADDQLGDPTPCPHYTVADLLDHIGGLAVAFAAVARKDIGEATQGAPGVGANLGDDWRTRIPAQVLAVAEAWDAPEAWEGMTQAGGVDIPGEVGGLIALDELVVHGWDLARATGQAYEPDDASVAGARAFLSGFASADAEAGPEVAFGPIVPVAEDAPSIDELVGLAGRDPGWSPD